MFHEPAGASRPTDRARASEAFPTTFSRGDEARHPSQWPSTMSIYVENSSCLMVLTRLSHNAIRFQLAQVWSTVSSY